MSTTTTTRPLGLGRTAGDIAVIARRDLLRSLRLPDVLVTSTVMPVIFILMFTYVFGGAIQTTLPPAAAGRYVNWLLPGLLAQFALFGGQGAAFRMAEDLATGVIDRLRSLPMARAAVPAGRTPLLLGGPAEQSATPEGINVILTGIEQVRFRRPALVGTQSARPWREGRCRGRAETGCAARCAPCQDLRSPSAASLL